jgi:hypothetical protein
MFIYMYINKNREKESLKKIYLFNDPLSFFHSTFFRRVVDFLTLIKK